MRANSTTTKHRGLLQSKALQFTRGFLYFSFGLDRKSTRLNSSHIQKSRMPSSA